jgi:hypothetical protein
MLAAAPGIASSLPEEAVRDSVLRCTRHSEAGDTLADLCRRTGVPHKALQEAFRWRKLIKLGTLLHLCFCLRIKPLAFLQGTFEPTYLSEIEMPTEFESSKRLALTSSYLYGEEEIEPLRQRARAYIYSCHTPPTLDEVALQLGVQGQYMYRRLPDICCEIAARRREFRALRRSA